MACDHNCKNCSIKGNCSEKKFFETKESNIKKIIAVMSGKGGVGKSTVTSLLASNMQKKGYKVGILDADITGPSIPQAFGVHERLKGTKEIMYPAQTKNNVKIVSINLLLDSETTPVLWRGPVIGNAIKQFYSEVAWGDLDYLFIDMPPGTSDIQLTILSNLPIDGIVMVSTPQDLVSMIVTKGINMANKMNIKMVGLIENMAYVKCPCCDNKIEIYGKSKLNDICLESHLVPLASLPIDPSLTKLVDEGKIEEYITNDFNVCINQIEML